MRLRGNNADAPAIHFLGCDVCFQELECASEDKRWNKVHEVVLRDMVGRGLTSEVKIDGTGRCRKNCRCGYWPALGADVAHHLVSTTPVVFQPSLQSYRWTRQARGVTRVCLVDNVSCDIVLMCCFNETIISFNFSMM